MSFFPLLFLNSPKNQNHLQMKIKTAYPSSSGPNLCYNHVYHCCFPGAVRSQQPKYLPIINGKRGVSDSRLYFVFLAFLTAFTLAFIFLKFFPQVFSYCNWFLWISNKILLANQWKIHVGTSFAYLKILIQTQKNKNRIVCHLYFKIYLCEKKNCHVLNIASWSIEILVNIY